MKLSERQIQFIDTYLKNSGVNYLDIRCEMTDHVAAALEEQEGDFEENFKCYILENKKSLLASNKQFQKQAGKKAVRLLTGNLLKLRFLGITTAIFLAIYLLSLVFPLEMIIKNIRIGFSIFIIMLLLYLWLTKSRFSVIDNVLGFAATSVYLIVIIIKADKWLENETLLLAYYAGFSAFTIEVLFTFWQLKKKYTLQYGS